MADTFLAQIEAFRVKSEAALLAVFRQSAQEVIADAQTPVARGGRMPIDTGFLRNSLASGRNGAAGTPGQDGYILAISGAKLGDSVQAGWTANYARHVEYGARGRAGRFFMRGAAQKWQVIVAANVAKVAK